MSKKLKLVDGDGEAVADSTPQDHRDGGVGTAAVDAAAPPLEAQFLGAMLAPASPQLMPVWGMHPQNIGQRVLMGMQNAGGLTKLEQATLMLCAAGASYKDMAVEDAVGIAEMVLRTCFETETEMAERRNALVATWEASRKVR